MSVLGLVKVKIISYFQVRKPKNTSNIICHTRKDKPVRYRPIIQTATYTPAIYNRSSIYLSIYLFICPVYLSICLFIDLFKT